MSPDAARGFREITPVSVAKTMRKKKSPRSRSKQRRVVSGYSSSEAEDDESHATADDSIGLQAHHSVPEGRKSWGLVPGREFMREQAGQTSPITVNDSADAIAKEGIPRYTHGHALMRDVAVDVVLPLPLSLCRVLLLDSTSPVVTTWEQDRGDSNFDRTNWTFPPATPRELERHSSEHQLIATGTMMGAHRTTTFDRLRNGSVVRLSETQIVDGDDTRKIAYTVSERLPRRGFAIKIRVVLRALRENLSSCNVTAEIRPVGKNMSNQTAVHKAFLLVLNETKTRYGVERYGLMNGLLNYVNNLPSSESSSSIPAGQMGKNLSGSKGISGSFHRTEPSQISDDGISNEKGSHSRTRDSQPDKQVSGLVSFEDMLKKKQPSQELRFVDRPATPSYMNDSGLNPLPKSKKSKSYENTDFVDMPIDETEESPDEEKEPATIQVKPLPKIRLSLMPSPKEEDEDNYSSSSPYPAPTRKKKSKSKRSRQSRSRTKVAA